MTFNEIKKIRQKMRPTNPGAFIYTEARQKNHNGTYIQIRQQIRAVINGIHNKLSPNDALISGLFTVQVYRRRL